MILPLGLQGNQGTTKHLAKLLISKEVVNGLIADKDVITAAEGQTTKIEIFPLHSSFAQGFKQ